MSPYRKDSSIPSPRSSRRTYSQPTSRRPIQHNNSSRSPKLASPTRPSIKVPSHPHGSESSFQQNRRGLALSNPEKTDYSPFPAHNDRASLVPEIDQSDDLRTMNTRSTSLSTIVSNYSTSSSSTNTITPAPLTAQSTTPFHHADLNKTLTTRQASYSTLESFPALTRDLSPDTEQHARRRQQHQPSRAQSLNQDRGNGVNYNTFHNSTIFFHRTGTCHYLPGSSRARFLAAENDTEVGAGLDNQDDNVDEVEERCGAFGLGRQWFRRGFSGRVSFTIVVVVLLGSLVAVMCLVLGVVIGAALKWAFPDWVDRTFGGGE